MNSSLTPNTAWTLGYCTNVHAGLDLPAIRENLDEYAVGVREKLGTESLGVGLWIPDPASRELVAAGAVSEFRDFLSDRGLLPYTINGFPFGNFHGDHVKQRVYLPTWADAARLEYTKRLAIILAGLLSDDHSIGSISTLPIGWPDNPFAETRDLDFDVAGKNLRELASFLQELLDKTGKRIVVAIEPEPGCALDTIDDMLDFFAQQLPEPSHRDFITACHDICHSAVMNESQRDVLQRYADVGIGIGKVQVSSAVVANWESISEAECRPTLRQLSEFAEDRYLHQTGEIDLDGNFELFDDLPMLLQQSDHESLATVARWVIHFHVPIFLERFGKLTTSRDAVIECIEALREPSIRDTFTGHLEVETYAWTVLPAEMRQRGLAEDIASELTWLSEQL